jgi:Tol biopolymer transport system component
MLVGATVLLAAAAGVALFTARGARRPAAPGPMRITKITNSGKVASPVLSPNGQFLAYRNVIEGRDAILVRQLASNSEVEVVAPQDGITLAALSFTPDGNWLLFSSRRRGEASRTLMQVSPLGGVAREVRSDFSGSVSFAPDGERFIFERSAGPGTSRFLVTTLESAARADTVKKCPDTAFAISGATWSPKKDDIAYVQIEKSDVLRPKVMVSGVSGGQPRALEGTQWMSISGLAWARDGAGLYLTGSRSWIERPRVWFLDAATGAARAVTQDLDSYAGITLRADGNALASVRTTVQSHLYRVPLDAAPAENAARAQRITHGTGLAGSPVLSPDGARIAYISDAGGHMDIWTMDAAGSNERQVTFGPAQDFAPAWSPDGERIAFASESEGSLQVWIAGAEGQNARQLTQQGTTNHAPSWSPDGAWIAYISVQGDSSFLERIPAAGGEPRRVTDLAVMFTTQWSPDGRWLATWLDPGKPSAQCDLACLPVDGGGEIRRFTFTPRDQFMMLSMRWTPDSSGLAYVATEGRTRSIEVLRLATGEKRPVLTFTGDDLIFSQTWAPDGASVILQRGSVLSDIVLIEPESR